MSVKKQYLKSKPQCKVTFRLDKKTVGDQARKAFLAAEFNEWRPENTPMKALKNGDFTVTVTLEKGREYQYRYVLDGKDWVTDSEADKYVNSGVDQSTQNSVVIV